MQGNTFTKTAKWMVPKGGAQCSGPECLKEPGFDLCNSIGCAFLKLWLGSLNQSLLSQIYVLLEEIFQKWVKP